MAETPLKSIQFPGLPDTYTVPQVEDLLTKILSEDVYGTDDLSQKEGTKGEIYFKKVGS